MVHDVLEGTPVERVVWMPAHKSKQAAGQYRCSNGDPITDGDIKGNAEADRLAKLAVEYHRVDPFTVQWWGNLFEQALTTAKWIARATWAANNCEEAPFRDTEANQWRSELSKKETKARKAAAAADNTACTATSDGKPNLRGHNPVQVLQLSGIRSGWRCSICRQMSSKKERLISRKCSGCPLIQWSRIEPNSEDEAPPKPVQQHRRMLSGSVLWCFKCGVYADKKSKGLKEICKGKPPRQTHRGGMEGQLRKLRNRIHPKTGAELPEAVELDRDQQCQSARSVDERRILPGNYTRMWPLSRLRSLRQILRRVQGGGAKF